MRVLGIDPSSQATGFGIIEYKEDSYTVLNYGTIKIPRRLSLEQKLHEIGLRLGEIMASYSPDEVAIENPFYAQNIRTAMTLGQVRGAVLAAIASRNCPLFEYSALEIKKAVTGYGQADKIQVKTMVRALLQIQDERLESDASDALAAAFCHLNSRLFQKRIEESEA